MPPPPTRTLACVLAALAAFAGNSLLCRLALKGGRIDPAGFTALRLASGAALLLCVARPWRRGAGGAWSLRSGAALLAYAIAFSLAYVTLEAGAGALLLFGAVQTTMLGAGLRRGERLGARGGLGLAAAVLGLGVLLAPGGLSAPDPGGALLMIAAGVAWGAYSLLGRGATRPAATTARNFALAAPLAAAVWLARADAAHSHRVGVALAVASGALASGLGYVAWYAALPALAATTAAIVQLAVPVLAAIGGVILLGEEPTARLAAASVLTLGGVALAAARR